MSAAVHTLRCSTPTHWPAPVRHACAGIEGAELPPPLRCPLLLRDHVLQEEGACGNSRVGDCVQLQVHFHAHFSAPARLPTAPPCPPSQAVPAAVRPPSLPLANAWHAYMHAPCCSSRPASITPHLLQLHLKPLPDLLPRHWVRHGGMDGLPQLAVPVVHPKHPQACGMGQAVAVACRAVLGAWVGGGWGRVTDWPALLLACSEL